MQPLYMLTAVDVRRAEVAGSSRATTIDKLQLPPIKFMKGSRTPGGGVMARDHVIPRLEPFEPKFSVKGFDEDMFDGMGLVERWTFAGSARVKGTNRSVAVRAIIEGAFCEWEPDESDPADFVGCTHMFSDVGHYELTWDGREVWYIDDDERVIRRKGLDLFEADRLALGG